MNDSTVPPTEGGPQDSADKEKSYLEKPTEYWNKRLDEHKRRLCIGVFSWFMTFLLFLIVPLFFGNEFTQLFHFIEIGKISVGSIMALSTYTFLLTYGMRLIGRFLYQEQVLKADAEFRGAMINTYDRLMRDGTITKEERPMILAAVFRPPILPAAQDGTLDINMAARHLRPPSS